MNTVQPALKRSPFSGGDRDQRPRPARDSAGGAEPLVSEAQVFGLTGETLVDPGKAPTSRLPDTLQQIVVGHDVDAPGIRAEPDLSSLHHPL